MGQKLSIAYHAVVLVIFAGAFIYAWMKVVEIRNSSAGYNAWLFPFACFSLSSWALWVLQYLISLAALFNYLPTDFLQKTGLCLGGMQIALWASSILPLRSKQSPGMLLILAIWLMSSIFIALGAFQTTYITSQMFSSFVAVSSGIVFFIFANAVVRVRHKMIFAAVFFLHGFFQFIWLSLWIKPWAETQIQLLTFPVWYIALLGVWIALISEMLVTLRVMISSTSEDLQEEREAAANALRRLRLESFRAETFGSHSAPPQTICESWAEECDIFILIIGARYGYVIESRGISAVEFEYEAAHAKDRGKILVYVKDGVNRDSPLEDFLKRLQDFECGHFRSFFNSPQELYEKIQHDVRQWLDLQKTESLERSKRSKFRLPSYR